MPSADSFDHVVDDLHRAFPTLRRGTVQRILIEEHDLLIGADAGDIIPAELHAAARERLARLTGADADELADEA